MPSGCQTGMMPPPRPPHRGEQTAARRFPSVPIRSTCRPPTGRPAKTRHRLRGRGSSETCLPLESSDPLRIREKGARKDLDRHIATKLRVARSVDLTLYRRPRGRRGSRTGRHGRRPQGACARIARNGWSLKYSVYATGSAVEYSTGWATGPRTVSRECRCSDVFDIARNIYGTDPATGFAFCDWSKSGLNQTRVVPWASFGRRAATIPSQYICSRREMRRLRTPLQLRIPAFPVRIDPARARMSR